MDTSARPLKPVFYWDGDCTFCRRWVDRWRATTAGRVDYQLLQEAPAAVLAAAGGLPPQRVVLEQADGSLVTGAKAALTALAPDSRGASLLLNLQDVIPGFARLTESAYAMVARHRGFCGFVTALLWGSSTLPPTYAISGWLFPRLMGLTFLFAFVSLWTQIDGLAGSQGILPVADCLENVRNHFAATGSSWDAWLHIPSLLWFGASDRLLHGWLSVGALASLLLLLGIRPALSAFVAWLCYLSFAAAVPVFLNFQWDALLLEAGLLVVLYVPWQRPSSAPSRVGRLLVWWLLFRLMFESGVVKLFGFDAGGDNAWLDGTALGYHYFTQPIPVWTSWWLARLPAWFQGFSLIVVFAIELALPFLILGPRRLRMLAFWGISGFMLFIAASGHFGFFNLLTIVLCVSLVDDASWPAACRGWFSRPETLSHTLQNRILPWVAAVLVALTGLQLLTALRITPPSWVAPLLKPFQPWRSANSYGLFSVMTTERPEITLEASADGARWEAYHFRYKPELEDGLPFFPPHMPRLDWQLWFAALEFRASGRIPEWMMPLLIRLQEKSPAVLGLFDQSVAMPSDPVYFRVRLDRLTYTSPEEKARTGRYWQAEALPGYTVEGRLER
ncbi:MAG: lipase maturation factor family protein [Chthoniobacterales bacterium]